MRGFASTIAATFAIANLYLLYLTGPLVSPQHQLIFHLPGDATPLFTAAVADLLALTLLLALLFFGARPHPRLRLLLWAVLLLPLPAILLVTVATFRGRPAGILLMVVFLFIPAALFSFTIARLGALLPWFRRRESGLLTSFSLLSLAGLLLFAQLLWNGWATRHLNPPFVPSAQILSTTADATQQKLQPRIVWVILDELSYRQISTDRQPGLPLPNFDRLSATSTVFTHTEAAADYTRIAIPSLLTGLPLIATVPSADGRHLFLHPGHSPWQPLDPRTPSSPTSRTPACGLRVTRRMSPSPSVSMSYPGSTWVSVFSGSTFMGLSQMFHSESSSLPRRQRANVWSPSDRAARISFSTVTASRNHT